MGAETLREAARLMRERAEAATPGVWISSIEGRDHLGGDDVILSDGEDIYPELRVDDRFNPNSDNDQDHIASWHPAVALAVADWLDATAASVDFAEGAFEMYHMRDESCDCVSHREVRAALAVARAYLGAPDS